MIDYLFAIGDCLPYLYALTFFISLGIYQRVSSILITASVVGFGEFMMNDIRDPLMSLALTSDRLMGVIFWTGTWLTCYLIMVFAITQLHVRSNISKTRGTQRILWFLCALSGLQIMRYLSSITIQSPIIHEIYQWGVPALNICIGISLLATLLKGTVDVNFNFKISLRRDLY